MVHRIVFNRPITRSVRKRARALPFFRTMLHYRALRIVYRPRSLHTESAVCNIIVKPAITGYAYQSRFTSLRDCIALISRLCNNNESKISRSENERVALSMRVSPLPLANKAARYNLFCISGNCIGRFMYM